MATDAQPTGGDRLPGESTDTFSLRLRLLGHRHLRVVLEKALETPDEVRPYIREAPLEHSGYPFRAEVYGYAIPDPTSRTVDEIWPAATEVLPPSVPPEPPPSEAQQFDYR